MKKLLKVLVVLVCAVMLVGGGILGTLAYLTSQTGTLTNTFTIGDVGITLTEGYVGTDGRHSLKDGKVERVMHGQGFKLIPGAYYDKDPIVHVDEGSENAYLYVKVVNEIKPIEAGFIDSAVNKMPSVNGDGNYDWTDTTAFPTIATQMAANGWKPLSVNGVRVEDVYYYDKTDDGKIGDQTVAKEDYTVFTKVYISAEVQDFAAHGTPAVNYKGKTIKITAFAIQAQGFEDAEHAWELAGDSFTA